MGEDRATVEAPLRPVWRGKDRVTVELEAPQGPANIDQDRATVEEQLVPAKMSKGQGNFGSTARAGW